MKQLTLILAFLTFGLYVSAQDSAAYVSRSLIIYDQLKAGKYQQVIDQMDSSMRSRLDTARLGMAWRNLTNRSGPLKGIVDTIFDHQPTYDIVILQAMFGEKKIDIKTVYGRMGAIKGIFFLPTDTRDKYQNPPYFHPEMFEETTGDVLNGEIKLKSILTVPKGKGKVPVVILIHGSGPNDKDETVGATKIFKDMAVGLAAKGVAVLRYEKRTRAYAAQYRHTKPILTPEEETVADALAAIRLVKNDPRIDTSRIFLIGHSMGGYMLPQIAKRAGVIDGMVLLCPPGRPLQQVLIEQTDYLLTAEKKPAAERTFMLDSLKRESVRIDALTESNKGDSVTILGLHPAYWLYLRDYDAYLTVKSSKVPAVVLYGGRDFQITDKDVAIWKANMKGVSGVTFKTYSDLNHFFIKGTGKSSPEEYTHSGNVEEKVIDDLASWILTGTISK